MKLVLEEDKIKEEAPERIVPFQELSGKQKLQHIWDYYKWKIILPILCAVCVVSIGMAVYENNKTSVFYAVFINTQMTDTESAALSQEFAEYADLDLKGKKMTFDTSVSINQKNADTASVYANQKLLAMFTSTEMDVILCDEDNFTYYASHDAFVPLSQVLPQEFLDAHEDLLLSAEGEDGTSYVCGISLASSPKLAEYDAYLTDPILTIPVTRMNEDNIALFISFLLGE